MSDFSDFSAKWKEVNDQCMIKVSRFSDYRNEIHLHRRGELIKPIKAPLSTLREIFAFAFGRLYLFSGYPTSGKTEILRFLAMHVSLELNIKCAVFTPESSIPVYFHELSILSKAMCNQGDEYIDEYWRVLEVDEGMPDVDQLIEVMETLVQMGFRFFIIDPMNWVTSSNYTSGMFESLRIALTKLKQFAKRTDSIVAYVEHPKTPHANKDGEYPKASVFAINGGVMHWNKCDCIVLMHRIRQVDPNGNSISGQSDDVEFEVAKMKDQKYLGYPGTRTISYDFTTHQYHDQKKLSLPSATFLPVGNGTSVNAFPKPNASAMDIRLPNEPNQVDDDSPF